MATMWDGVAGAWADEAAFVDAQLASATEALLDAAGVRAGRRVLEVACGPGGAGLAARARGAEVTFSDVAPAMLAVATGRAGGAPGVVGDQARLDVADGSFDAVLNRHGLMFAEPPAAAAAEAARVLRAGGRYAAMAWAAREDNPWLGAVLDAVGEQFGVPFPPPGVAGPFSLDDPGALEATLREGGLDDVRVERVDTPMAVTSLEEWWARVPRLAGPLEQALAAMPEMDRHAIRDRALAAGEAAATQTDDGITMAGAVLIAAGTAP